MFKISLNGEVFPDTFKSLKQARQVMIFHRSITPKRFKWAVVPQLKLIKGGKYE